MARNEDIRERRRREEKEALARDQTRAQASPRSRSQGKAETQDGKFDQLLDQAESTIHQLQQLYNMYVRGMEKLAPVEKRKQLDQLMATLAATPKLTASMKFKYAGAQSSYLIHRDRWDRLLKALEDGKLKRGPLAVKRAKKTTN